MPVPRLSGWLRCLGMLSLSCWSPAWAFAEDNLLTDKAVPSEFRQSKVDATEDSLPYHGLTMVQSGNSAGALKRAAIADVPLDLLQPSERAKTAAILKETSLFRRLPTISFEVEPQVYHYFLNHPDVAVSTWKAMGISKFTLQHHQPGIYSADAGDGSRGTVAVMYSTPEETIIRCEGAFKSPLLPKPIVANSIMRLKVKFDRQTDGRVIATHHGDVFVELPSQTVETIAKLISPVSHSIADKNFKQLTFYVHMMTVAMSRQPGWVEKLALRMEDISDAQREEFLKMSASTYIAARQREVAEQGQAVSLEEILRPLKGSESTPTISPANGRSKTPARFASQSARSQTLK